LLEHTGGTLPPWLSPIQARILTIGEKHADFGNEVYKMLRTAGIRAEIDTSAETLGKKIREGKTQKIPYLLVIGDKEVESKTVTVETNRGESGKAVSPQNFKDMLLQEIKNRSN